MILEIAVSLLAVAGFGVVLVRSRILPVARSAIDSAMAGLASMMDGELDDDAKEQAVRRAGLTLLGSAFSIAWRFALALAAAALPILVADAVGLVSSDAVLSLMLRLDYIVIVSVVAIVLAEIVRRLRRPTQAGSDVAADHTQYSAVDRFYHVIAFSSPAVLKFASRMEDRLVDTAAREPEAPPIFVTSLARGGTTAVLNALHDIPGVATHTYRDMPFLTAPSLWNKLSGGNKRNVTRRQRAHGDGLEIDLDSPEAFEEVIWKLYWPEKFRGGKISLWRDEDRKPDAEQFFERHMAKIVRARYPEAEADGPLRYCSKNNGNVARLGFLPQAFPESHIVVPVRRPESHAASLLRQHKNFLDLQAQDDFVRRYMRDIGHFEFGQILRPIAFPGFEPGAHEPTTQDYWLAYWIHAFREVLGHHDKCLIVLQDDLRETPDKTMGALCDTLNLPAGGRAFREYFHSQPDHTATEGFSTALRGEAADVYRELSARAVR